ncbi:Uncharacterised protein [Streptococcus pneumoniae]|nr:Uncharacterised protein [Streptococcus pneumoniae]
MEWNQEVFEEGKVKAKTAEYPNSANAIVPQAKASIIKTTAST